MKNSVIILLLNALSVTAGFAQKQFTKEQLQNDMDTMYAVITEIHPNPFYQYPKENFDRDFNQLKYNLNDSMTSFEFYKVIVPLIAKLNDAHTNITPQRANEQNQKLFPFRVQITDELDLYVIDSYGNLKLPKGTQLTHLNGKTSKDIITELLTFTFGETDYFKRNYLELKFSDYLTNIYDDSLFTINYMDEKGQNLTAIAEGVETTIVDQAISKLIPEKAFDLTLDKVNKIAILNFNSADVPVEMAQEFFKASFDSINKAGIEHLIIDARFNTGGTDLVGNELLKYLSKVPFNQYEGTDTKISHRLVDKSEWYKNYPDIIERLEKEGAYIIPAKDEKRHLFEPYPDSSQFHGKSYLLIGFLNFSAATDFSWTFWKLGLGTVIGEETGGLGHSYGSTVGHVMPNTQLKYTVSHKLFYNYMADENSVHGVKPDIEVPYEEALDFTLNAIKMDQSKIPIHNKMNE